MSLKKITSLVMLLAMIVMVYTGIMLFISPPGRIANWANWQLFGLSKEEYAGIHTAFMVLFIVATILHLFYSWKPMMSYLKNRAREMVIFTKEMIVATLLTLLFLVGTIYKVSPFSDFLDFGADVSDSWIGEYGEPPYGHAELSSLQLFIKKMRLDQERSLEALKSSGITYGSIDESLKDIATANHTSPNAIYELMRANQTTSDGARSIELDEVSGKYTGIGKRKVVDVAQVVGLTTQELIAKLATIGIQATPDDKFKDICESANMAPSDVIEKLGL